MDPITLAILAGMGGTALSNAPALLPSKLNQENKKRLEELKRREEADALGLTEKEEALITGKLRSGARAQQQFGADERNRLLAGSGMATGGQALQQAVAQEQQAMQLETDVAGSVLQADLIEREKETDEMRALEAAIQERRDEQVQAVADIAGAGLEGAMTTGAQQATIQGGKEISSAAVSDLSQKLGVSEDEARGLYDLSLTNPEAFEYFLMLQRK